MIDDGSESGWMSTDANYIDGERGCTHTAARGNKESGAGAEGAMYVREKQKKRTLHAAVSVAQLGKADNVAEDLASVETDVTFSKVAFGHVPQPLRVGTHCFGIELLA